MMQQRETLLVKKYNFQYAIIQDEN